MLEHSLLPRLSFPDAVFGEKETPWNLTILLYRGGAEARANKAGQLVSDGALGDPQLERLELVSRLHEEINAPLARGGSRETAATQIRVLRDFVGFADRTGRPLTIDAVVETYYAWTDSLFLRTRMRRKAEGRNLPEQRPLSMPSAYANGTTVGKLLDSALERNVRVAEMTRLEPPRQRHTAGGVRAERQNLTDTFTFGHLAQDVCDGLTIQTILNAPLPISIPLRNGNELVRGKPLHPGHESSRERPSLMNLRMEAELHMFVGQTGMNRAQAVGLQLRHFFYVSHLDGYQVKDRKNRRKGTVLFEIFKDFKPHFERYLEWRRTLFPNSNHVFPFIGLADTRQEKRFQGYRLRQLCKDLGIRYMPLGSLRNTRVNWLLRTTADPNLTAEMVQHTKQTLHRVYERPSHQRALGEEIRFWSKVDPHLAKTQALAPGGCTGDPKSVLDMPEDAPKPDCTKSSGCLWCENHRDVDSLDYTWALVSFKHLKVIELSKASKPQRDDDVPPAKRAIDRINEKLIWFKQSSQLRRQWVEEAEARIDEGDFHPDWRQTVSELEGTT